MISLGSNPTPGPTPFGAPDDSRPIVRLAAVSKAFGDLVAVRDVDVKIGRGEFVTLLGPSGCGKSTLLRMIAGFEEPTSGAIELDGRDLAGTPPERRPLNMVFQSYALFPHMNVFENVAYGLRAARVPEPQLRERVSRALELVDLEQRRNESVTTLSGGQSQRVALARALVNEPRVLLLDEPLGALDLQLRKRMQVELREIQHRVGTTFIFVTHDQEEALVMSHRIVLMHEGRVVQVGSPNDVYHHPVDRFAAGFVGESTLVPCSVERLDANGATVMIEGASTALVIQRVGRGVRPGMEAMLALRPEHVRPAAPGAGGLRGVVVDCIFMGARSHCLVQLSNGSRLRCEYDERSAVEVGDNLEFDVAPGGGVVVA